MIAFAQKPGLNAYWVTSHDFIVLNGRHFQENKDVTGYGRFTPANMCARWEFPWPKIFKDGDHWCALVGDNLQEGTAEFSPVDDRDERDQITDLGLAFRKAHPELKHTDRFVHWLPHEIAMMAAEAKAVPTRTPQVSPPIREAKQ